MNINEFLEQNPEFREIFNTQAKLNSVMLIAVDYRDTLINQLINIYITLKNENNRLIQEIKEAEEKINKSNKLLKEEINKLKENKI